MTALSEIGIYILQTLGGFYLLIILLRFLLQLARGDFYNPISQFVAKATNAPLRLIRKIIPGFAGIDWACLLLALIVQFVTIYLSALAAGLLTLNPLSALVWAVIGILSMVTYIYFVALIAVIILSWVAPFSQNPAALLVRQLVTPICAPLQKIIPPMGGLDISPIFVFLLLQVVRILLTHAAHATQLLTPIVPGVM